MATVAIDTLRLAKRLKEAGFSEPQAEAMADALKEAREGDLSQLASKADLAALKGDLVALRADLGTQKAELEAKILESENRLMLRFARMTAWAVGIVLAGLGAATTVTVTLIRSGLAPHP